jgi:guanosine-3',5'-bis(diphosphate) 3'-pyrophosphohydrolase
MKITVPETADVAVILRAAKFAADAHRDQRRKDQNSSPYINHPLALADLLANEGEITDPDVIVAALLHDVVEDTDTDIAEIHAKFGPVVAGIVAQVSDDKSLDPAERKRLQVVKAASKSDQAKLVKLADKTCNLRDIATAPPVDWPVERRIAYYDWARDVVQGLRGVNPQLERAFDQAYHARTALT